MATLALKVPPVVWVLLTAGAMLALHLIGPRFQIPWAEAITLGLMALALLVILLGITAFGRAKTTINPHTPQKSNKLVIRGIYRASRNPMYLGFLIALTSWAVYLGAMLPWLALPAFMWALTAWQIKPEETALEARFGDDYRTYKARVRRWI